MRRALDILGSPTPTQRLATVAVPLIILAGFAVLDLAAALRGWLIGFVLVGGVAIGAVALLLVHRLTGGRWGYAAGPPLRAAAGVTPWLLAAFVPVLLGAALLYPWVSDPHAAAPGVATLYLNLPAFAVRGVATLVGWSVLAALVVRGRCGMATAGLGLVFHAVMVSLISIDWILSLDPRYSSSAFGAEIAVQQIASALAFAAVLAPMGEPRTRGDVGALLLTAALGTFYISFMSFLIVWYGNLPPKAAWYLQRMQSGWQWLALAAICFGFVVPLSALAVERVRRGRAALRLSGVSVLLGAFCHDAWLIAPGAGALSLLCGLMAVATIALGGAVTLPLFAWRPREAAHG